MCGGRREPDPILPEPIKVEAPRAVATAEPEPEKKASPSVGGLADSSESSGKDKQTTGLAVKGAVVSGGSTAKGGSVQSVRRGRGNAGGAASGRRRASAGLGL